MKIKQNIKSISFFAKKRLATKSQKKENTFSVVNQSLGLEGSRIQGKNKLE